MYYVNIKKIILPVQKKTKERINDHVKAAVSFYFRDTKRLQFV